MVKVTKNFCLNPRLAALLQGYDGSGSALIERLLFAHFSVNPKGEIDDAKIKKKIKTKKSEISALKAQLIDNERVREKSCMKKQVKRHFF